MKKSTIVIILTSVMVVFAGSGVGAWHYAKQAEVAAQLEAKRLDQEREAARLEAEQLAQEREATRRDAERLAQEREAARLEAERLAQEREQQQRAAARERLTTQTADVWRELTIVLDNAESALSNNSHTPAQVTAYIANELADISTAQIDADLASLIEDFRSTAKAANQVIVSYDNRMKQLDAGYSEAAQLGCDIGRASVQDDRPGYWDCLVGGVLGYVVVEAGTNQEIEQLKVNLNSRLDALGKQWTVLDERKGAMGSYLSTTYGLILPE